jgi:tetratricopeptide (TPR) repeat protein
MDPILRLQKAESHLAQGRPARALPLLSRLAGTGDRFFRADVLHRRAEALRALSRFEEALQDYWKAHKLYRLSGVLSERIRTLLGASACLRVLSRYGEADRMWRSVSSLLPRLKDPAPEEISLEIGLVLRGLGRTREAVRRLRAVIPHLAARKDLEGLQHAWWAVAGAERFSGRYDLALGAFDRAAGLAKLNKDVSAEAFAWCGRAGCLRILGRGRDSFLDYKRAHAVFRRTGDLFGEAYGLCGMGNSLRTYGDPRKTLPLYQRSALLYARVGDEGSRAFALWGLGGASRRLGKLNDAVRLYRQALASFRKVRDTRGVLMALLGWGRTEAELGKTAAALARLSQAAALARKENHPYEEALARLEMERASARPLNAGRFKRFGVPVSAVKAWKDLP